MESAEIAETRSIPLSPRMRAVMTMNSEADVRVAVVSSVLPDLRL